MSDFQKLDRRLKYRKPKLSFTAKERVFMQGAKVFDSLDKLFGKIKRIKATWTNRW